MDFFAYNTFTWIFFLTCLAVLIGLFKPQIFYKVTKGIKPRKKILLTGLTISIVSLTLIGIFEPASIKNARLEKEKLAAIAQQKEEQAAATELKAKQLAVAKKAAASIAESKKAAAAKRAAQLKQQELTKLNYWHK